MDTRSRYKLWVEEVLTLPRFLKCMTNCPSLHYHSRHREDGKKTCTAANTALSKVCGREVLTQVNAVNFMTKLRKLRFLMVFIVQNSGNNTISKTILNNSEINNSL